MDKLAPANDPAAGEALKLGVLLSGSGTNLQAIIDACERGALPARVVVVISDRPEAYGLVRAEKHGIPGVVVERQAFKSSSDFNHYILSLLKSHDVQLVVMAGYMRLLGKEVLDAYPDAVLNIHPALLPSFAGAHGIRDALDRGVKVTGVTIHFANEVFDHGPIIAQEAIVVADDDTEESLAERIHAVEHRLYPAVIKLYAEGRLHVDGRKVRIIEEAKTAG